MCLVSDQPKERRKGRLRDDIGELSEDQHGGRGLVYRSFTVHSLLHKHTWQLMVLLFPGFESKICNITSKVKVLGEKLTCSDRAS